MKKANKKEMELRAGFFDDLLAQSQQLRGSKDKVTKNINKLKTGPKDHG